MARLVGAPSRFSADRDRTGSHGGWSRPQGPARARDPTAGARSRAAYNGDALRESPDDL